MQRLKRNDRVKGLAAKVAGEVVAPDQAQRLVRVLFAQGAEHLLRHVDARDAQVREPGKEGVQLQAVPQPQVQHVARVPPGRA